jgi:hypothetical protein
VLSVALKYPNDLLREREGEFSNMMAGVGELGRVIAWVARFSEFYRQDPVRDAEDMVGRSCGVCDTYWMLRCEDTECPRCQCCISELEKRECTCFTSGVVSAAKRLPYPATILTDTRGTNGVQLLRLPRVVQSAGLVKATKVEGIWLLRKFKLTIDVGMCFGI